MEIPHKKTKDGIVIGVKVQPRSSRRGIEIKGEEIKVRLTSPPVDNKANEYSPPLYQIGRQLYNITKC